MSYEMNEGQNWYKIVLLSALAEGNRYLCSN